MKILWLTIDRTNRVASHIFAGLQHAVAERIHVDFVIRQLDAEAGDFCRQVVMKGRQIPPLLNLDIVNDYDLIFTDAIFGFMSERWHDVKVPKAVLMEDQHGPMVRKYMERAYHDFKFDIFCVRYKDATKKFHPYLYSKPVIWLPHSISCDIFKDYMREKTISCLSTGINNPKSYPFRAKANDELSGTSFYKRVERPPEHSPNEKDGWPVGRDYAELLNSSKITITDTLRFGYPTMKIFEIPACASALCSNYIPELGDLGFIPGENMIEMKETDDLKKLITEWLASEKLDKLTQNGHSLILERHTTETRATGFITSMEKSI